MLYNVVSINFSKLGKKYYFETANLDLQFGDKVIVETIRGLELGFVAESPKAIEESELIQPLKPVLRKATDRDYQQYLNNQEEQPEILTRCSQLIKKNNLDMKLLNCEYTLDRAKLIIYFNAEGRVDFRDLVKDLANQFRVRIELRQVGTRDGARVLGGIGPCGLLTCCTTFLGEFETVSIKMAKNQNLSLNPTNISGLCGKLFCCINYEDANYKEYRKSMPKLDSYVFTANGRGKVVQVNFLTQTVKVEYPDRTATLYPVSELQFKQPATEDDLGTPAEKDLKDLEG
ncbi:MAG: stage 0 sporulation family protein [Candidatus Izemoplasmatales bacterium]|jgi:cell fate regulator YaaT (PSP1 superfamily)|nr:stage 0 sporulation family protein [Candidatus Izemoplasmatales bacterium]MDD4595822.1 stage 0 sporulation family protein [Candidatus Izemoplasmatales bacterium]